MKQQSCPDKELVISWLYDEIDADDRARVDAHVARCEACRTEVDGLTAVRRQLGAWHAPVLATGFEIQVVPRTRRADAARPDPPVWPARRWLPAFGYAAAAALVLGVSLGVANLSIRYGAEGLVVRTGWGGGAAEPAPPAPTGPAAEPWRAALSDVEARLRVDLTRAAGDAVASRIPPAAEVRAAAVDADAPSNRVLLRQLQEAIDASEVRQQQNLALRIAEIARDFELQRRTDLVQIEQGIGRLGIDAVQHRQMWDYFRRVSSQQPR